MKLIIESDHMSDYLKGGLPVIQFDAPLIQKQIKTITSKTDSKREQAKLAFEFLRDAI